MKSLTILIPLSLVGFVLLGTTFGASPEPDGAPDGAPNVAIATIPIVVVPARETIRLAPTSTLPAPTPTKAVPTPLPASLPTQVPEAPPEPTAVTLAQLPFRAERENCDPAYPEERTCIPPGPPFKQGCAITEERLFTVLPPDPQHLDHDGDGIGCEPIK
jgi:hypothetical protein